MPPLLLDSLATNRDAHPRSTRFATVFKIFQRLQRSDEFPGTGVGLAMVQKAMEGMGGRVWCESEPGRGAVFHLAFRQSVP